MNDSKFYGRVLPFSRPGLGDAPAAAESQGGRLTGREPDPSMRAAVGYGWWGASRGLTSLLVTAKESCSSSIARSTETS